MASEVTEWNGEEVLSTLPMEESVARSATTMGLNDLEFVG